MCIFKITAATEVTDLGDETTVNPSIEVSSLFEDSVATEDADLNTGSPSTSTTELSVTETREKENTEASTNDMWTVMATTDKIEDIPTVTSFAEDVSYVSTVTVSPTVEEDGEIATTESTITIFSTEEDVTEISTHKPSTSASTEARSQKSGRKYTDSNNFRRGFNPPRGCHRIRYQIKDCDLLMVAGFQVQEGRRSRRAKALSSGAASTALCPAAMRCVGRGETWCCSQKFWDTQFYGMGHNL